MMSMSQVNGNGNGVRKNKFLSGFKEASASGFAGFLFGELVSAILQLSSTNTALATVFPFISTLGAIAFGFLHGIDEAT